MNMRMFRWIYRKATEFLGEEEMDSLKNDLITPVKIAAKEATADIVSDMKKQHAGKSRQE